MSLSKVLPVTLLLSGLFLTGCTHTRQVNDESTTNISFEELNQTLEGRRVDIKLKDERTIASTALRIQPDTTWAIDMLSGRVRGSSTREIHSISWKRPGRGAKEGALLGGIGGAVIGLAAGLALTSVRDADTARTSVAQYVSVITGFGVILGVGSGTLIGVRRGSHDRYVYPQLQQSYVGSASANVGEGQPSSVPRN